MWYHRVKTGATSKLTSQESPPQNENETLKAAGDAVLVLLEVLARKLITLMGNFSPHIITTFVL